MSEQGDALPFVWRAVHVEQAVDSGAGALEPGWWVVGWPPHGGGDRPLAEAVVALRAQAAAELLDAERRHDVEVGTLRRVAEEVQSALTLRRLSRLAPPEPN